jgi:exodeoxyribonuclease VII small subunit
MTYTEARKELEMIVSAIESGEPDVDTLTGKVKRASELIAFCRRKLTETDKDLRKILDDIA